MGNDEVPRLRNIKARRVKVFLPGFEVRSPRTVTMRPNIGSSCTSTAVEHTPLEERLWGQIPPGGGLFVFSFSSVVRL